jgi:hypothetical protein
MQLDYAHTAYTPAYAARTPTRPARLTYTTYAALLKWQPSLLAGLPATYIYAHSVYIQVLCTCLS